MILLVSRIISWVQKIPKALLLNSDLFKTIIVLADRFYNFLKVVKSSIARVFITSRRMMVLTVTGQVSHLQL